MSLKNSIFFKYIFSLFLSNIFLFIISVISLLRASLLLAKWYQEIFPEAFYRYGDHYWFCQPEAFWEYFWYSLRIGMGYSYES